MMQVVVCSESEVKLDAVKKGLALLKLEGDIMGVKVPSEVSEQPIDEETEAGAKNRLANARKLHPKADLIIAIENGLFFENKQWVDRAVVALHQKGEDSYTVLVSEGVVFPSKYVEQAKATRFEKTAGKFMAEDGVVAKHNDPHIDLAGVSRADILAATLTKALQKKFEKSLPSQVMGDPYSMRGISEAQRSKLVPNTTRMPAFSKADKNAGKAEKKCLG